MKKRKKTFINIFKKKNIKNIFINHKCLKILHYGNWNLNVRYLFLIYLYFCLVKNGKFGKAKEYLKKNIYREIQLSFKLIERGTKLVKNEIKTSSFLLKDTIIYLNDEIVEM